MLRRLFAGCTLARDIFVCAILIVLFGGAVLPGVAQRARETAKRVQCASNLRQIGQAILLFSNENRGAYPRARYDPAQADKPTAYTKPEAADPMAADGPGPNDVTAAMFLLLRTQDITSEVFVCPSTNARKWNFGGGTNAPINRSNFPSQRHLSYSYANSYPNKEAASAGYALTNKLGQDFAVAADMNPGNEALLKLTPASSAEPMRAGNSPNHGGEGQNVLFGDGHVGWHPDPFRGVRRDNIYTFGPSGEHVKDSGGAGIVGSPVGPDDSVLLPIATAGAVKPDPALAAATQPRGKFGWSTDEAVAQLKLHPRDPYLQYVVLQLGRRGDDVDAAADEVRQITRRGDWDGGGRQSPDLFALVTGAPAVQESLQLDAMTGQDPNRPQQPRAVGAPQGATAPATAPTTAPVSLKDLTPPTVKSHPWKQMLGDQRPQVSALSKCVPDDFYLAEFRSTAKLVEALDSADLWSTHLFTATVQEATDYRVAERLLAQLALGDAKTLATVTDSLADEVAVTGSDPFLREGSDFTVLLHVRDPDRVGRLDEMLAKAQSLRKDVRREEIDVAGVRVAHLATPDRAVDAYSARPAPHVYVRSNSRAALERIVRTVKREGDARPLGESLEFQYIRTLMPRGAAEEDGLIYLSDPLIRNLVGPRLKLTERRRLLCYNHLRMIGHGALLHRTETGKPPASIEQLVQTQCLPPKLDCPDRGAYSLHPDGARGVCSVHGRSDFLTPNLELPLENITAVEAEQYRQFVERYNQYWRQFFDPIAIRLRTNEHQHRVETIILPLIDNSIYTAMSRALAGDGSEPQPLDATPVPPRNIFSFAMRYNKKALLAKADENAELMLGELLGEDAAGDGDEGAAKLVRDFLANGIGDQVSLHVYDARPMFGFDLTGFLGTMARMGEFEREMMPFAALIASLNSPVYLAVPVKDAQVVDRFLAQADRALAVEARHATDVGGIISFRRDFYRTGDPHAATAAAPAAPAAPGTRVQSLHVGPLTFRIFWARVGDMLYLSSKSFVLDDLAGASAATTKPSSPRDGGDVAHAMVRLRPDHWNEVLPDYEMAWGEKSRLACLENLGPLSDAARALAASGASPPTADEIMALTSRTFGARLYCPNGGRYAPASDARHVACTVHGSAAAPVQPTASSAGLAQTMRQLRRVTATLTFLEDGLHAVLTVDRAGVRND